MQKVAIFGAAGAIGHAVAAELERRSVPFRVVGRNRRRLEQEFGAMRGVEIFDADLGDPRSAGAAARGCDTIIYAVGVPYTNFGLHPRLMRTTVDAAVAVSVQRIVVVSAVYSYGVPETPKVAETHPRLPAAFKGRMRKEQEDIALDAQKSGRLQALVVRLPDFYGPYADISFANGEVFRKALQDKKANWLGSVDVPHEFVFVPDAGRVIVELAAQPDVYGEAWNFGGPGAITGREFINEVYRAAGREPKWRTAGRNMLTVAGWFNPLMKELVEMQYLFETPVIFDDSKLLRKLGDVPKTPYADGIRLTLEWMRGMTTARR
jgi:nucleoside-diphosphate-sugar epimerase